MPAAEDAQVCADTRQIVIFDIRPCRIEPVRGAGCHVVDRLGALAAGLANGGGGRMECSACVIANFVQLSAGGLAQLIHGIPGFFAKLRCCLCEFR